MTDVVLPEILEKEIFGNKVVLKCFIPDDLLYFKGHFPQMPVLPGVTQLHWAVSYANEFFRITSSINQITTIKFMKIILPKNIVFITLEYYPDLKCFTFAYSYEDKIYSTGRLNIK